MAENGGRDMARQRRSDEAILKLLREIKLKLAGGSEVPLTRLSVGVSDATDYVYGPLPL
jgi:putative transposase